MTERIRNNDPNQAALEVSQPKDSSLPAIGVVGAVRLRGALNHNGDLAHNGDLGFFGAAVAAQQANIADPAGGAVIDAEARVAINAILDLLEAYGLMPPA